MANSGWSVAQRVPRVAYDLADGTQK